MNFKGICSVRPFLSLGNNFGDEFTHTSSTFIFESQSEGDRLVASLRSCFIKPIFDLKL